MPGARTEKSLPSRQPLRMISASSSIDATKSPIEKVHGAAFAMLLRLPTITSLFASMKVSPSHARLRIPTIAVIPDCGHAMMVEQPDAVLDALRGFL